MPAVAPVGRSCVSPLSEAVEDSGRENGKLISAIMDQPRTELNGSEPDSRPAVKPEKHTEKQQKTSKKFVDEDSKNPEYKSDEWRMKHFKVIPCNKRYAHDWTICPFAHPGEKARRRDPNVHTYDGIACPEMKKLGHCSLGDDCKYAHNVFEYWMHPARYRTQMCNDGPHCARHACFFAHNHAELRNTPLSRATAALERSSGLNGFDNSAGPSLESVDRQFSQLMNCSNSSAQSNVQRSLSLPKEDLARNFEGLKNEQNLTVDLSSACGSNEASQQASNMFSQLLRNGLEGGQELAPAPAEDVNSKEYENRVMAAIQNLDYSEVKTLLQLAQDQLGQYAAAPGLDAQPSLQNRLNPSADLQMALGMGRQQSRNPSLQTAPAGLESFMSQSSAFSHNSAMLDDLQQNATYPSRLLSNDIGALSGLYNNQGLTPPSWQSGNLRRMSNQLPDIGRSTSSNLLPRVGVEQQYPGNAFNQLHPTNSNSSPHSRSALQNQPFRLDEMMSSPSPVGRQRNLPVASAFQQPASQEWKSTPGRGIQNDLNWRYSGGVPMASGDGQRIPLDLAAQTQLGQQQDFRNLKDWEVSRSVDHEIDRLKQSLSCQAVPGRPRNPSAQHSAPYDLENMYLPGWDGQNLQNLPDPTGGMWRQK